MKKIEVPVEPRPPRRAWWVLVSLFAAAGLIWLVFQNFTARAKEGADTAVRVRTASVQSGTILRTVRLTGVTTALRSASVTVPRLQGLRPAGTATSTSSTTSTSTSTTSSTGSSTTGSGSATTAGTSSSTTGSSSSTAFRGSTNRFSSNSTAKTNSSSTKSSSTAATTSDSGSSNNSGRLSGGSNDFTQVLESIAQPGIRVKKGDVVAVFDRQYQILRLDDYKADMEQAERSLSTLQAQLDVDRNAHDLSVKQAAATLDKAKLDLQTTPVRSAIVAEQLKLAMQEADARLKELRAETPFVGVSQKSQKRSSEIDVAQARNELKRAQGNVDIMAVKAPIDGMVVMQNIFRGAEFGQVQEGDQLYPGQMFMQIVDPTSMLVSSTINQADVEKVRLGAKAQLRFDAYPGLVLPGHVVSIGALANPGGQRASFVRDVPVFLKIDDVDPKVIPDLSVSADIVVESKENQLVVPMESVFRDGAAAAAQSYVWVRGPQGFTRRDITLGIRNYVQAAVTSGLQPGELVALEPPRPAKSSGKS